jgi:hypothetical protein
LLLGSFVCSEAESRANLDRIAALQRQREEEAEAKMRQPTSNGAYVPPGRYVDIPTTPDLTRSTILTMQRSSFIFLATRRLSPTCSRPSGRVPFTNSARPAAASGAPDAAPAPAWRPSAASNQAPPSSQAFGGASRFGEREPVRGGGGNWGPASASAPVNVVAPAADASSGRKRFNFTNSAKQAPNPE